VRDHLEGIVAHQFDGALIFGYGIATDSEIGPDGKAPERDAYADVLLMKRLVSAIDRLNPDIPTEARGDALRKVLSVEKPSLIEENRRLHRLMVEGVDVEFYSEDGTIRGDKVRLIDFDELAANDWLASGQFTVVEGGANRRPDVVLFVNGLPLGVIELKAPGGENATLTGAFNQLQTYKAQIPSLFRTNAVLVTSDGITARIGQYSDSDQRQAGIDEAEAVAVLLEKYEVVKAMYHGFDYARGLMGTPHERLVVLAEAIEWILGCQHEAATKESNEDGKRREHRRYQDAVLALSKAFALASASDEARNIREEVGFFQAVRAALVKSAASAGKSAADREFAIQQILDRAVVSTEIVDILAAAGITTPDISILSDEFLAEVQQLEKKNLALEALRKLLNDEIRSRSKANVVETKRFSERLEAAIARYHTNAISTVEVLQELIDLAKEVRAARRRGQDEGLSQDEIAFYDALSEGAQLVEHDLFQRGFGQPGHHATSTS